MARKSTGYRQPANAAGSGQIATVPVTPKFQPLKPRPHLRQDEIDAQPVLKSMPWDGKGVFWRQGSVGFVGKGE